MSLIQKLQDKKLTQTNEFDLETTRQKINPDISKEFPFTVQSYFAFKTLMQLHFSYLPNPPIYNYCSSSNSYIIFSLIVIEYNLLGLYNVTFMYVFRGLTIWHQTILAMENSLIEIMFIILVSKFSRSRFNICGKELQISNWIQ